VAPITLSDTALESASPEATEERPLPKPNYAFAKRQRDLAKQQKKEEKKLKKAAAKTPPAETPADPPAPDADKMDR
jgi:hypothetical protein